MIRTSTKRGRILLTFAVGLNICPCTNTRKLFVAPDVLTHASHSACNARRTRVSSPEYRSRGQYSSAASAPSELFMCACMQKRQVVVFTGAVSVERWVADGRKPHFGCAWIVVRW